MKMFSPFCCLVAASFSFLQAQTPPATAPDAAEKAAEVIYEWDFSSAAPFIYRFEAGELTVRQNRMPTGWGGNTWAPGSSGEVSLTQDEGDLRGCVVLTNLDSTRSSQFFTTENGKIDVFSGQTYFIELVYSTKGLAAPTLNYRLLPISETFDFEPILIDDVDSSSNSNVNQGRILAVPHKEEDDVHSFKCGFQIKDGAATLTLVIFNRGHVPEDKLLIRSVKISTKNN